jgi:hypothetical protein
MVEEASERVTGLLAMTFPNIMSAVQVLLHTQRRQNWVGNSNDIRLDERTTVHKEGKSGNYW